MRRTETNKRTTGSRTRLENTRIRHQALLLAAVAIFTLASAAPAAYASCGLRAGIKGGGVTLPVLAGANTQMRDMPYDSIVGLWQTAYTQTNGDPFGQSFKQWHSDGTEFENVDHSAVIGNICFGVWKQLGNRTFRLHHMGWTFDASGNPTGTFTIDETDVVAPNGMSYTGSFVFKTYKTDGTYTGTEITGKIVASRITVD